MKKQQAAVSLGNFLKAIRKGDKEIVSLAIAQRVELNANIRDNRILVSNGGTPLETAINSKHVGEIVRMLLNARANPNAYSNDVPLFLAVQCDAGKDVLAALLDAHADVNVLSECTILHAIPHSDRAVHYSKILLHRGATGCLTQLDAGGRFAWEEGEEGKARDGEAPLDVYLRHQAVLFRVELEKAVHEHLLQPLGCIAVSYLFRSDFSPSIHEGH